MEMLQMSWNRQRFEFVDLKRSEMVVELLNVRPLETWHLLISQPLRVRRCELLRY